MSGLANGFVNLFKAGRKSIGNAIDNFWLDADAKKAISDEVINKFQPMIDKARRYESKRAANIKDLGDKLNQSKQDLADARKAWQDKYDAELAAAKAQRQTDINNYDTQLKVYQDALSNAKTGKQNILDQLKDSEDQYDIYRTIYTDVNTGHKYILNPLTGKSEDLTKLYPNLNTKDVQALTNKIQDYDNRLFDNKSGKVINAFDKSAEKQYKGKNIFDSYYSNKISAQNAALRDADNQIKKAKSDLYAWNSSNSKPAAWNDITDSKQFLNDYKKNNGRSPNEYSFNGKTYTKEADLDKDYQKALAHEQRNQGIDNRIASRYVSKRDAEIAKRIQDAKDIKKAKLALGGTLGAGALYAGAKAIYGGDDTDTTDNIDNTDNTYTGESDPDFNVEKEGQAILKDRQQVDTDFDPDKAEAEAVLAGAAYDKGVEDGSSVRSSDDLGNNIGASTRGHTMDDRLYELIKAMKDPYKADAIANYIYSRHGDDPEVQNLGWRGWLNKYYGDSLRSIMNIDPSGYKGMHISGGL